MTYIKIDNGFAIRSPLPAFLVGLSREDVSDLSWTDPRLGVQALRWYKEERDWAHLLEGERHSEEVLAIDYDRKVVTSIRQAEPDPDYLTPEPVMIFSVLEFRDRFTYEEQIAIKQATLTDVEIGLVYDNFLSASFIDLADPRVHHGLELYQQKGLLTKERKGQIMSAKEAHA